MGFGDGTHGLKEVDVFCSFAAFSTLATAFCVFPRREVGIFPSHSLPCLCIPSFLALSGPFLFFSFLFLSIPCLLFTTLQRHSCRFFPIPPFFFLFSLNFWPRRSEPTQADGEDGNTRPRARTFEADGDSGGVRFGLEMGGFASSAFAITTTTTTTALLQIKYRLVQTDIETDNSG